MPWVKMDNDSRYARRLLGEVKGTTRFLLDNNVDADLMLRFLDGHGLSAQLLPLGLIDRPDHEVLAEAWRQDRVLLTHDTDFLNMQVHPPETNPGVVVMPGGSGNLEKFLPTIRFMLTLMRPWRSLWLQSYIHIMESETVGIKGVNATNGAEISPWFLRFDEAGDPYSWRNEDES